ALLQSAAPLAIFPMWASLRQISPDYLEAAADLGSGGLGTYRRIVLPLSIPGVIAAAQLVFLFSLGAFVAPNPFGGGRVLLTAELIYDNETNLDWPKGAVEAILLIAISLFVVFLATMLSRRIWRGSLAS